jgi:hypothetical protein
LKGTQSAASSHKAKDVEVFSTRTIAEAIDHVTLVGGAGFDSPPNTGEGGRLLWWYILLLANVRTAWENSAL